MKEPANHWVDTGIMNVINLLEPEIGISTLPSDKVEGDNGAEEWK